MATGILNLDQLVAGEYYIPVFERIDPAGPELFDKYRTDGPFFQYLGNGEFLTEDGEEVHGFYDPELGLDVATNATDGFLR